MTFDEKLFALLTGGSPPIVPVLGANWWANNAAEGTALPYGIYQLVSSPQILTHDRQTSTHQWRYQFQIIDDEYLRGRQSMRLLTAFLSAYTDAPAPGIMRFIELTERSGYLEIERGHCQYADFDVMENIP